MKPREKFVFWGDCVQAEGRHVRDMVDEYSEEVSLRTFRARCAGVSEWAAGKGYARSVESGSGVTLANDWHVSYHRGTFRGSPCYWLKWSGFENIWLPPDWRPPMCVRCGDEGVPSIGDACSECEEYRCPACLHYSMHVGHRIYCEHGCALKWHEHGTLMIDDDDYGPEDVGDCPQETR